MVKRSDLGKTNMLLLEKKKIYVIIVNKIAKYEHLIFFSNDGLKGSWGIQPPTKSIKKHFILFKFIDPRNRNNTFYIIY